MDSLASIEKPLVLLGCAYLSWKIVKHIWSSMNNVEKEPVTVLVTGASGLIGYTLVPMIARGLMLGPDQPVFIRMLDVDRPFFIETMNSRKMELIDSAFPLLKGVVVTTDLVEACTDADIAILLDGFPRKQVMKRKDVLMRKNMQIYKARASALEQYASPDCKVLLVGDMANTDALVLKQFAPSIPEKNITCLTRLDHNRALAQLSERLNVPVSDLKNVVIWGNHSPTQYPDASHAMAETCKGPKLVTELIDDQEWLKTEFVSTVQDRCGARDHSTALSTASSACDHVRDWILGTPKGTWVSMGVCSDGSYGVPHGLMYSFPVTCEKGNWSIVQGLKIDEFSREKMDTTAQELIEEKSLAYSYMN